MGSNVYDNPAAASRYNPARRLPPQTMFLWMETLKSYVPKQQIKKILDLGCGTGQFTFALSETFDCPVIGVDPSIAMLEVANTLIEPNIHWEKGTAENIPLPNQTIDLVFMSQVFHHLVGPIEVLQEVNRVLTAGGYLAIRNGTREHNQEIRWLEFFPEALEIEEKRMPSKQEVRELVCSQSFLTVSDRTINQVSALSPQDYLEKVSRRALSSLMMIGDDAFERGLRRLRHWANQQPSYLPIYEPLELFVFQSIPGD